MRSPLPSPIRLFRPRPPEDFQGGIVAKYYEKDNIVTYNREFFNLRNHKDFGTLNRMTEPYLLATTE